MLGNTKSMKNQGQILKERNRAPQAIQTTVELFAGIGGFRLAAETHDIQTLWANDICPSACKVYRSQFGGTEIRQGDIRAFVHEIPSHDLLTAGFPCQPFSSAGKKRDFATLVGIFSLSLLIS